MRTSAATLPLYPNQHGDKIEKTFYLLLISITLIISCTTSEEYSLEELEKMGATGLAQILLKTEFKPWRGEEFLPGRIGGTWTSHIIQDPKSFNLLIAEQDSSTSAIMGNTLDWLLEYDVVKREWVPRIASAQIIINEKNDALYKKNDTQKKSTETKLTVLPPMQVIFTLRDDLYWSYYESDKKVKITSDDVIFGMTKL